MRAVVVIGLLFAAAPAEAEEVFDADLLQRAEAAFRHGVELRDSQPDQARASFAAASHAYEELYQRGFENAALAHNLGSAYFVAGDLPHAVFAYRRGLRSSPCDRQLHRDLEFARQQVEYSATSDLGRRAPERWPPWLLGTLRLASLGTAWLLYALGWLSLTRWRMLRRRRLLRLAALAIIGGLIAASVVLLAEWSGGADADRALVVIQKDAVPLRTGNGTNYPTPYEGRLNRGVEARLLHARHGWLQIELAGGEIGWVPDAVALVDRPR